MSDSPRGLPVKDRIPLKSIRRSMAQSMKASVDNSALSQVTREIDVTALQQSRKESQADTSQRTSLNTLIMAAVARTLPQHPLVNAELVDREILVYDTVNLGMAVATPDGLIVVVVPEAHLMTLMELSAAIAAKVEKTRNGSLSLKDVEGGTFTVSNLGMYGIDTGFPIPRPPEAAILLVGEARAKPTVKNAEIVVREIAWFSLCYDHRIIDGATAAAFLKDLDKLIGEPGALFV